MRFIPPRKNRNPISYGPRAGMKGALSSLIVGIPLSVALVWFSGTFLWLLVIPVFALANYFVRKPLPAKEQALTHAKVLW